MSARIAWHDRGWDGNICNNPKANVYCVGQYSTPGEMVAENRELDKEINVKSKHCSQIKDFIPPCVYSINAFGTERIRAYSDPPDFFKGEAKSIEWELPQATICTWPYELMYLEEVKKGKGYDNDRRMELAKAYFEQFEAKKSLVFYYANYSNPLNISDERKYAIVGISRLNTIGPVRYYEGCSSDIKERYANGQTWQRDITSCYPDEGFRIPYHIYMNEPEKLEKITCFPENSRLFKYGTREISDVNALGLVEGFLNITSNLKEIGDSSENWDVRISWLQSLMAELWNSRGLYPGMAKVLDYLRFGNAIIYWKKEVLNSNEVSAKDELFRLIEGECDNIDGLDIESKDLKKIRRQWLLKSEAERILLGQVFPRYDIEPFQIEAILSENRAENGIYSSLEEIASNPYLICEEYMGDDPDDFISFNKIDHGVFPSPSLGGEKIFEGDDPERLRALCIEQLRKEGKHAFMSAKQIIHNINHKLSFLPDWKKHQFSERYFEVDKEKLSAALVFRKHSDNLYVYWKPIYEMEREIENDMRELLSRADINLKFPVTSQHWQNYLTDPNSDIAKAAPEEYKKVIRNQIIVCQKIFVRPISVLSGGAGTGKTTVIKSIIKAVEKAHSSGSSFKLLAPTGKAADRLREATGKDASTVHSFIASLGWLNPNYTFRREGGSREDKYQTIIVDEASMLDLQLSATLFRAINWQCVQRLILVGDPNQLPPIGRGIFFSDTIGWLKSASEESLGILADNIRQMENRIKSQGQSILDLAEIYMQENSCNPLELKAKAEVMLKKVQEGGKIDKDLDVVYWNGPDELEGKLIEKIISDMQNDTNQEFDPERPFELWSKASCKDSSKSRRTDYLQIITPYRSELFGTDYLNSCIQHHIHAIPNNSDGKELDGIRLFDKVIQIKNRTKSKPIYGYNIDTRKAQQVDVFNGELGYVKPHAFDGRKWKTNFFRLNKFQVVFSRKENIWVGYGRGLGKNPEGRWIAEQNVAENLELAYVISVHKSQGSEFDRLYLIVPKNKTTLLSQELFYTGITRAKKHCTVFIEEDISPLLEMRKKYRSDVMQINSSTFCFDPLPEDIVSFNPWYEDSKIYSTLTEYLVRSKSEVIIANMLSERDIRFKYEEPLYAPDGTFYLPDFTVTSKGNTYYWEHWGRLDDEGYANHTETKKDWYKQYFPGQLIESFERTDITDQARLLIESHLVE